MTFDDIYTFAREWWVVWFMALFLGIIIWAFLPSKKDEFEKASKLPLEED